MKPETMINKRVNITDKESMYFKHWGFVKLFDGDSYHISGGSIATEENPNITPIFDRDQFAVKRK
jgi:hypothetical protein